MRLISITRNPIPNGAIVGRFKGYDGKPLRYARWEPTVSKRHGTICVFTGYSEYIEKYFETVSDLRRRGFYVAVMDWRGNGASYRPTNDPRKGHIHDFSEYERDIECYMRDIITPSCPPPFIALAHSMGGNIILRYISRPENFFNRIVLSSPMVKIHSSILYLPSEVIHILCKSAITLGWRKAYVFGGNAYDGIMKDFDTNKLTSSYERYLRNYKLQQVASSLLVGSPTIGWLNAALRSIKTINHPDYFAKLRVPALIFSAGMDTVVPSQAINEYATRLKVGTGIFLPDSKHEILQEKNNIRAQFWATFDAYFDI
ncbi:MAG: Lysophospholipase L2 [Hyphomicrobiaceae bacterium hypho_1]